MLRSALLAQVSGSLLNVLAVASLPLIPAPAPAQSVDVAEPITFSAVRALNLARNHAVQLNGGLSIYRPASCMFGSAGSSNPCLVQSTAEGFLFRFLGGPPGWEQLSLPPNRETELLIAPDGRSVLNVIYNGFPR